MITFKKGVDRSGLRDKILLALTVIDPVFHKRGVDTVVTSTTGDKHVLYSAHWRGDAVDIRSRNLKDEKTKIIVLDELQDKLGEDYSVGWHSRNHRWNQHYHIAWKPLKGT